MAVHWASKHCSCYGKLGFDRLDFGMQEAKAELEVATAAARGQMETEKLATRADILQRKGAINAESDELMKRLGLVRPTIGGRATAAAAAAAAAAARA